jgi:serine phosphatase RsbU (regulator of sigma subunit)
MSGEEALKALEEQKDFQIIVSDFNMPRMDGITFLNRSLEKSPESIRIMLTGEGDFQIATKAVNEGNIFRFITKPCSLEQLEKILTDAQRQYQLTQIEKEARNQELAIAGEIQQNLLIGMVPKALQGLEVADLTVPSKYVDGDFIDFFSFSNECFDLIVGDVMGKGLHAAMVGAGARNQLARVLWQKALSHDSSDKQPEAIMESFRTHIAPGLEQVQKFITMIYARIDRSKNIMSFVDAGHTPILWFSSEQRKWLSLKGENSPVGLPDSQSCRQIEVKFATDDIFVFYSDGLLDGRNSRGEYFGDCILMECVENMINLSAKELLQALDREYRKFTENKELVDDLTLVVVKAI